MFSWFDNYPFLIIGRKWLQQVNILLNWSDNTITVSRADEKKFTLRPQNSRSSMPSIAFRKISINQLVKTVQNGKEEIFAVRVYVPCENFSLKCSS